MLVLIHKFFCVNGGAGIAAYFLRETKPTTVFCPPGKLHEQICYCKIPYPLHYTPLLNMENFGINTYIYIFIT